MGGTRSSLGQKATFTTIARSPMRIGIAGAGPAGLSIAGILAREAPGKFIIDVFERDSRERDQGSGWDIDAAGRKTLQRAGLDPATISRPGSTSFRMYKAYSNEPYFVVGLPAPLNRLFKGDPETNRHAMREGLLAAIGKGATCTFQKGISDVRPNGKGGIECVGADGSVLGDYDLVIDASGVSSPLRKHRVPGSDVKECYTGLSLLGGVIQDPEEELDPEIVRRMGQGTLSVMGDRHDGNGAMTMVLQRFGAREEDHRAAMGVGMVRKGVSDLSNELGLPATSRPLEQKETDKVRTWLKKEMGDRWDPMYLQSVDCLTNITIRPIFMFNPQILPDSSSTLPLVCVGDALHFLAPFTGSGGNLALADAGELATLLVNHVMSKENVNLLARLRDLELKFFHRAGKVVTSWGEPRRKSTLHTLTTKNACSDFSLATLFQGETGWSPLKRVLYTIALFYMWLHKLSNYGLSKQFKHKAI